MKATSPPWVSVRSRGLVLWHAVLTSFAAVLNGFVSGLAGITPCSGYVESYWAALLGVIFGCVSYSAIMLFKVLAIPYVGILCCDVHVVLPSLGKIEN